jgi:hypothetical protein
MNVDISNNILYRNLSNYLTALISEDITESLDTIIGTNIYNLENNLNILNTTNIADTSSLTTSTINILQNPNIDRFNFVNTSPQQLNNVYGNFLENFVMDQINFYVWFKYLDDADRNIDELLNEFYELFYGPAGKHIKAFVSKAETIWWDSSNYTALIRKGKEHLDEKNSWEVMCPPKVLKEFGKIMASAHAAAKTPIQKKRVS